MPGLNLSEAITESIDSQPERKPPLLLSRNRTAEILLVEALVSRRKRKPRKADSK